MALSKVLIANRGEIAVRVARACRDAGIASVAVYADPDRDAPHVLAADEAYALGGDTPAASYLDAAKILAAAAQSGADAVHPGYGFLSENADFAQAVLDAGLTWIGPPPQAIRDLGDKVAARKIAQRVGAPLVAGTPGPVSGAAEAVAFAQEHGLPVAIKAAFGGGGRGLKVARTMAEIPELYESAVREAVAAFGRGECFVERYLDRPRHVETQCLADAHGTVVVVSTRDCSLQRRHQKLVEEAPAPFLSSEQDALLRTASKAILREAGYIGAGTCEFLIGQDGTISFLEVNTRLQVEHPVTEEVTGIDLVREMFRIAAGEPLGAWPDGTAGDPRPRGHAIEFRINAEDPGRGFLPAPGTLTTWRPPSGPGVRLDAGVQAGSVIGPAWDSLLGKLIVTGATRTQALQRAARALAEFEAGGLPTALAFHRAVVTDPAFAPEMHGAAGPFTVHTRWIETEFRNDIPPYAADATDEPAGVEGSGERETVVVEVNGKRFEVTLPGTFAHGNGSAARPGATPRNRPTKKRGGTAASGNALTAPMQGTIIKVAADEGQEVAAGDLIIVLEAMKMEQPVNAHKSGTISSLTAKVGATLASGATICEITDLRGRRFRRWPPGPGGDSLLPSDHAADAVTDMVCSTVYISRKSFAMSASQSRVLELHPRHGIHAPTVETPSRAPASVRRTSSIDMLRPDGLTGDLLLVGTARDLVTAADGSATVVAEATVEAAIGFLPNREVRRLTTSPDHPGAVQLIGKRASSGFRGALESAFADHKEQRSLLYLLLDDIPVTTLISGHALVAGQVQLHRAAALILQKPNLCAGWRDDGTIMEGVRRDGRAPVVTGPAAPSLELDDRLDWHPMSTLPPTGMRRQRRLDVSRQDGQLLIDAMFRDTYVTANGIPTIIHEYVVNGLADAAALTITEIGATPHVLPWVECPFAADSARDLVGQPIAGLRRHVRDSLTGVPSCTHLNDLLRSLEDIVGLAALV
jgi:acetyl-CoA/propionyl-CoA carboxylase biotin carboxyl carrier protein